MNNEFLMNSGRAVSVKCFNRNRLHSGIGYQGSPEFHLQLGYLNPMTNISHVLVPQVHRLLHMHLSFKMGQEPSFKKQKTVGLI